jgi:hypothetical protein
VSKVVEFSPPRAWRWRWHGEEDPRETRKWLVQDLLPETGAGLIAGQWGTYKTFVALDLAATVMTKATFIKFPVRRQGGVLFFACEGQSEIVIRLAAVVETKCGGLDKAPFAWVDTCPRLLDPTAGKILADMVKDAADKMIKDFGLPVALVIIDTAGKAAGYAKSGDENDAALGKIMMKAQAAASIETGALFLAVDHFGKDASVGTRGTSGKEDDADVVLALLGEKGIGGTVATPRLCARKRRSGPNGEEFSFRTRVVDLGPDENGAPVTTLTIDWLSQIETSAGATKPKNEAWSKSLRLLRQTLMTTLVDCGHDTRPYPDGPTMRTVDVETVRREFYASYMADGTPEQKTATRQKAFKRAVSDAQERGLVGLRVVDGVTLIWLAVAQEGSTNA